MNMDDICQFGDIGSAFGGGGGLEAEAEVNAEPKEATYELK
jgi:hypothetical protein